MKKLNALTYITLTRIQGKNTDIVLPKIYSHLYQKPEILERKLFNLFPEQENAEND